MSVSWVFTIDKIEFQYVSDQKKVFVWDKRVDDALPSYVLPKDLKELDKQSFIGICHALRKQIK